MLQALGQFEQAWRSTTPCEVSSNACQTREIWLAQQAAQAADRYLTVLGSAVGVMISNGEMAAPPAASGIAVLPFESLTADKENIFLTDGLYDGVSMRLGKLVNLKVISHDSVAKYRGARNTEEIGRALNVAYVLEGSVRREAGRIYVNAQLIDTRTDAHVWAQGYDRDLSDVFTL
jgi:TolB-like protein